MEENLLKPYSVQRFVHTNSPPTYTNYKLLLSNSDKFIKMHNKNIQDVFALMIHLGRVLGGMGMVGRVRWVGWVGR